MVLDRATELFWTKGYEETSMRDLEEGLGVGRQSLYSTFGDKRDLFLAALDRYAALQQERIEPLLAPDAGLAYPGVPPVFSPAACSEPRRSCMMLNSVVEFGQADAEVARRYLANQEHIMGAFRHALSGAVRKGELPASIDQNTGALPPEPDVRPGGVVEGRRDSPRRSRVSLRRRCPRSVGGLFSWSILERSVNNQK